MLLFKWTVTCSIKDGGKADMNDETGEELFKLIDDTLNEHDLRIRAEKLLLANQELQTWLKDHKMDLVLKATY